VWLFRTLRFNSLICRYIHFSFLFLFPQIYVSAGTKAAYYLPQSKVQSLQDTFTSLINKHGFHQGLDLALQDLLSALKVALQGFTVAHIILTVNAILVVVVTLLILFYIFVKESHINVWGDETLLLIWESFLKLVSGVWLVQFIIMVIAAISHKGHGQGLFWALVTAFLGLFGCVVMFYLSKGVHGYAPRT